MLSVGARRKHRLPTTKEAVTRQFVELEKPVALRRNIGVFKAMNIVVGCTIGGGIFISPKGILINSGSVGTAMIVWSICGVITLLGALSYIELGTTIQRCGGDYAYIKEAFGPILAFLRLWTQMIIIRPAVIAVICRTAATYCVKPFFEYCEPPTLSVDLLAAAIIVLLTFVNCFRLSWATKVQDFCAVGKVAGLGLIIFAGLLDVWFGKGTLKNFTFEGPPLDPSKLSQAFYSGMFAYAGWFYLNTVTEEIHRPEKTMPRAMIIGEVVVIAMYLLTIFAYHIVMSAQDVIDSSAVAVTFAKSAMGSLGWTVPIAVLISCVGVANGIFLATSRVMYAGARDGTLPTILKTLHVTKCTPMPAIILLCPISLGMLAVSDVSQLITFLSSVRWLFIGMSALAIPWLRYKQPYRHRPVRYPVWIPIVFAACCVAMVTMSGYSSPIAMATGLGITATGLPVYWLVRVQKPAWLQNCIDNMTVKLQLLLKCLEEQADDEDAKKSEVAKAIDHSVIPKEKRRYKNGHTYATTAL
ncbi:cystine/glutamate transporter-like [Branchiostoma lanceolatum]|uniref:cystine/glutamate transporter-like n=1 Tax=Branchiostoma lanceolatum TaxID=7740 RepID=UPI003453199F